MSYFKDLYLECSVEETPTHFIYGLKREKVLHREIFFITLKTAREPVQVSRKFFFVPSLIDTEFRFTLIFYAASKRVLYRILPLTIT